MLSRDAGDCSSIFLSSGEGYFQECNRNVCPPLSEDYYNSAPLDCVSMCFNASCDWSRTMCYKERASLATCPLFDAAVLHSVTEARFNRTLRFVMGGTARFACCRILVLLIFEVIVLFGLRGYGRCNDVTECYQPVYNTTLQLNPDGAFRGSSESAAFSGIDDWLYVAPAKKLDQTSSAFTISASRTIIIFHALKRAKFCLDCY